MLLRAVLTKEELVAVALDLTPLRVELGRRPRRTATFGRPNLVELVRGAGLRLRGDARFTWDVRGLTIPVVVRRWQVLLAPRVVARGDDHVLAFEPSIEALDIVNVPSFVETAIADAVNEGMTAKGSKLAWNFTRTLSLDKLLSDKLAPAVRLRLTPGAAAVEVTDTEVCLTLSLEASVGRLDEAPAAERHSPAA